MLIPKICTACHLIYELAGVATGATRAGVATGATRARVRDSPCLQGMHAGCRGIVNLLSTGPIGVRESLCFRLATVRFLGRGFICC